MWPSAAGRVTASPSRREPLLDALRALAMVGVLVVNALSYPVAPWGAPLGEPAPPTVGVLGAHALAALLLHGKAYPLLAFLFGAGLVMAGRHVDELQQYRRLRRLLVLGVLHGALIYCGDILTMYALCGFLVLGHVGESAGRLYRRLGRAALLALAAIGASVGLSLYAGQDGFAYAAGGFGQTATWVDQLWLNLSAYAWLQGFAAMLFLPVLRAAMLAGMLAARLRLLTHKRWRPLWRRCLRVGLPVGLAANAVYALGLTDAVANEGAGSIWLAVAPAIGWLLTMPLVGAAVLLAQPARAGGAAWVRWLAPLGRRTLSLYLLHSMLCVALFSGVGAGWPLPIPWGWLWALGLWLVALVAARGLEAAGWRGPFEAWLGRS